MQSPSLDIDIVRAFLLVADLGSFTRAAEVMETSQAATSLKLKRLEEKLGCRLLERTPRQVRLSRHGDAFLPAARDLLEAHDRALSGLALPPAARLALGISDHVAGPELPNLIRRLSAYDPGLVLEVRIAASRELIALYDRGELDAVIIRRGDGRSDGEKLVSEPFGWFAAPSFRHVPGDPILLASLAAPCGIRAMAINALDEAGIAWREAFVGGGVLALGAAVTAGLAVAALAARVVPAGAVEVGEAFGLPALPRIDVTLHARPGDRRTRDMLRTLSAAFRGLAGR
jgi:DNA-binding transcriptional LysR family regulator